MLSLSPTTVLQPILLAVRAQRDPATTLGFFIDVLPAVHVGTTINPPGFHQHFPHRSHASRPPTQPAKSTIMPTSTQSFSIPILSSRQSIRDTRRGSGGLSFWGFHLCPRHRLARSQYQTRSCQRPEHRYSCFISTELKHQGHGQGARNRFDRRHLRR